MNVSSVHSAQAVAVPSPRRFDIKRFVPVFALAAGVAIGATTMAMLDDSGTTTSESAHAGISLALPTSADAAERWTTTAAAPSLPTSADAAERWTTVAAPSLPTSADAAERWTTVAAPSLPTSADAAERWTTTDTTSVPSSPDAAERWID